VQALLKTRAVVVPFPAHSSVQHAQANACTQQAKKAAVGKKAVLAPSNASNIAVAAAAPVAPASKAQAGGKALEEIYQKKSQLEHILLRPDTYIGSVDKQLCVLWVHDGTRMVQKVVSYVPGLYKIFDEILVNAADNMVRDPTMDAIKVVIDAVSRANLHAHYMSNASTLPHADGSH
jgi:DNA topoisomerase-2